MSFIKSCSISRKCFRKSLKIVVQRVVILLNNASLTSPSRRGGGMSSFLDRCSSWTLTHVVNMAGPPTLGTNLTYSSGLCTVRTTIRHHRFIQLINMIIIFLTVAVPINKARNSDRLKLTFINSC